MMICYLVPPFTTLSVESQKLIFFFYFLRVIFSGVSLLLESILASEKLSQFERVVTCETLL